MPKRLHMTSADYVAIAISPALIMLLVGSLVYFLIEVFYAGDYQGRLNYVFALFVFSAVLIARIAIEMGSERAALFALPLGIATFLVLMKFVEHPSPFSHVINLALIGVIWWCAHKLTWDSTLIDDDEDASGQGLLQRIGVDQPTAGEKTLPSSQAGNELLTDKEEDRVFAPRWWQRFVATKKGPHTPGLWVLYFSLAALPLFGIGQHWIPASAIGRRRYAFGLLAVYVFSALALLVTTSFLGLRRYLRQRNVEMPAPMAGNWVTVGAALIAIVMFIAALLPRPSAEVAISQVPWQAKSPDGLSSSRYGVGNDGANNPEQPGKVVSENQDAPQGDAVDPAQQSDSAAQGSAQQNGAEQPQSKTGGEASDSQSMGRSDPNDSQSTDQSSESQTDGPADRQESTTNTGSQPPTQSQRSDKEKPPSESPSGSDGQLPQRSTDDEAPADSRGTMSTRMLEHRDTANPLQVPQQVFSALGGLVGLLKLVFYVVVALLLLYLFWKNRHSLLQAIADTLREIRKLIARLFGGGGASAADDTADGEVSARPRRRTFAEFRDPFAGGTYRRTPPEELVRYTFDAFEAWASDHGTPRTVDQTPHELLRAAVAPQTQLHAEARRLVQLYNQLAYASGAVSREDAEALRHLWRMMQAAKLEPLTTSI